MPAVVAIAILLLVFVGGLNLVVDEYAKGAIRTALDEGAQAGAVLGGSLEACQAQADEVRHDLLPGVFASSVQVSCSLQGDEVVATARGHLPSLVPPVPAFQVSLAGASVVERVPEQ